MRTLEDSWLEISPYLDEVLEKDTSARETWLDDLETRAPQIAARVRAYLRRLENLADRNFLEAGTVSVLNPPASLAGQRFGAYTLDRPIGHGGMGTVWLAHRSDGRFEGQVAVKLLNTALVGHPSERRFVREGSVLARLRHPNIAHLLDAGVAAGHQPYLVLEYVRGERIDLYCDRHGLNINQRVRLFIDVLRAVAHAHSNLVVHRDLKPSNILVTDHGNVKLLDFGVAALLSRRGGDVTHLTGPNAPGLTPGFAAPEQLLGDSITTATDVYALGTVLFELLAGRHPLVGNDEKEKTSAELIKLTLDSDPPRLSDVAVDVRWRRVLRGDLENIVAMALHKNPDERYTTAELFLQDLRRYLALEPVSARPRSFAYLATRFIRRNRAVVTSVSAVALALIATGAFAVWQMVEANRQRQVAEDQASRAEFTRDFLEFVLTDAGTSGRPFTTSELLQRAEKSIQAQYSTANHPLAIEQLINLGILFAGLGQNRKAMELVDLAHRRAIAGNYVDLRRQAACELGRLYHYAGRIRESAALLGATVAELKREAPESPALIECLEQESDLDLTQQEVATGIAAARESVALAKKLFPGSNLRQVTPRIQLATAYRAGGELRVADEMYRETLDLLKSLGRERSADGVLLYSSWAAVRSDIGDIVGATRMVESALDIGRALRADATPDQVVNVNYARRLVLLNRLDEAEERFSRAKRMAGGEDDADMEAISLLGLAAVKRGRGEVEEARAALEAAGHFIRMHFPTDHPARAGLLFESGLVELAAGRFFEAKEVLGRVIAEYRRTKTYVPNQIVALSGLAESEGALGDYGLATRHAAEASLLAGQFAVPGEPSYWVGYSQLAQARVELALGNTESARAFSAKALAQLIPTVGRDHPLTGKAATLAQMSSLPPNSR
jgi:eukaryotic-like serine/threonine-protein kinase